MRRMREQAERSIEEQRAELRDLLLLTLDDAGDDGDVEFIRTVHERAERLLTLAAIAS